MHHALDLQEILYNVFGHLVPEGRVCTHGGFPGTSVLAKLGRTCQVFKEPALDVLWSELPDLSALVRCVPDAIHSKKRSHYALKRPLTEAEWVIIRSYARRVWIFRVCTLTDACLEEDSLATLFSASPTLFPNLRSLSWAYGNPLSPLHTTSQPLRFLHLDCRSGEIPECRKILESSGNCPLITRFRLQLSHPHVEFDSVLSNNILRWSNLQMVQCNEVALSTDAILHIARMSILTHLSFVLNEEALGGILHSDLDLAFSRLTWCEITSGRLLSVANLLARCRLPVINEFIVKFPGSLAQQTIRSFTMALKNTCSSGTLTHLSVLSQHHLFRRLSICVDDGLNSDCEITYDSLSPCKALASLRSLKVNFEQPIRLTDNDLVDLGSAWPHLEDLIVNDIAGWRSHGGLTLHGLIRLLRACPSLRDLCVLFDTPTFTKIPEGMDVSYPQRQLGRVNLVESPLKPDMFAGVVNVFVGIGFLPRFLVAWPRAEIEHQSTVLFAQTFRRSWREVGDEVKARIACGTSEGKDELGP